MSKGSNQRPMEITMEEYDNHYDLIFRKKQIPQPLQKELALQADEKIEGNKALEEIHYK